MSPAITLPSRWREVRDEERAELTAALRLEMIEGHVLACESADALARREGADDVLFALDDGRVAEVHLTWTAPSGPSWPATMIFEDVAAWSNSKVEV
jgi:hypothetical protein